MHNYNSKFKSKKQQPTFLEVVLLGIFRSLWFLVKLPFRGWQKKAGISPEKRNEIITKRHNIESLLNSESEIELKHAVMEADKLVDYVLKIKNYSGDTFADRLRSAEKDIAPALYNEIWQGHKVRNQLAHDDINFNKPELSEATRKLLKYTRDI